MPRHPLPTVLLALALASCAETLTARDAAPTHCVFASARTCPSGASCPADDGCNTCTCSNGSLTCSERACVDAAPVQDLPPLVDAPDAPDAARAGPGGTCHADGDCAPSLRCVYPADCSPWREGRCVDTAGCERRPSTTTYCDCEGHDFETISACAPVARYHHAGPCEPPTDAGADAIVDAGADALVDAGADAPVDADTVSRYATAMLTWESYGDIGAGPAVMVTGSGVVYTWRSGGGIGGFPEPPPPGGTEVRLGAAVTDELFARWERAPLAGLPHAPYARRFCDVIVMVRLCARCERVVFLYGRSAQVAPELDEVLAWFAAHVPTTDPATFCEPDP